MNFFEGQIPREFITIRQVWQKMLKMFLHPEQIMVTTIMKTLESINSIIEHTENH